MDCYRCRKFCFGRLDANGNLTSDGAVNFTYDTENRLISASGAKTANLIYDPLGRLYEVNQGGVIKTRFIYDGDALVLEYDQFGTIRQRYVHGNGVDQPLVWYDGGTVNATNRRHLFANWQGSITAITDASGNAVQVNAYDAYGIPNATNLGRFQYTGQILIPEIGIYHYKARAYSPYLGRFLQTDPIGYEDGMHLYAYVGNDPVGRVDPTGTSARIREENRQKGLKRQRKAMAARKKARMQEQIQQDRARYNGARPTGNNQHLSQEEARQHFNFGGGRPVDVDASKLTLILDKIPKKPGDTVGATVAGTDYFVHGRNNVTLQSDGSYRMVNGQYDFDQQTGAAPGRNLLTRMGEQSVTYGGRTQGQAFEIRYHGEPRVKLPYNPNDATCGLCNGY